MWGIGYTTGQGDVMREFEAVLRGGEYVEESVYGGGDGLEGG